MNLNLDPRQVLLFAIALLVPTILIATRRERALVAWVCFTLGIHVLDTAILTNLPAARLVGILLLPRAILSGGALLRIRPGRALLLQYGYLVLLGLILGILFPWPSGTVARAFNQAAPGRAMIYLVRTAADVSLAYFVASQVVRMPKRVAVLNYVLVGTTVASLSGLLEYVTRIDLYGTITGLVPLSLPFRMRGFAFEPRGLGLIAVQGLLICLVLYSRRRTWRMLGLAALHVLALFLSGSTSAVAVLLFAAFVLFLADRRFRASAYLPTAVVGAVVTLLVVSQPQYFETYLENARLRLTTERIGETERPDSIVGDFAARMDILDGPPVLFLASNPVYIVVGAGPGLMSLPAAAYIPPAAFYDVYRVTGVNSPPTSGLLTEVANAGLVGLTLWGVIYFASLRSFGRLTRCRGPEGSDWSTLRAAYVAIGASYLVQASVSPVWAVFVGCGLGAAFVDAARRRSASMMTRADGRATG